MKTTFRSRIQRLLAHANSLRAANAARASRAQGTAQILRFPDGGLVRTRERAAMAQVLRGKQGAADEPTHAFPCGSATQSHRNGRTSLRLVQEGGGENRDRVGARWRAAAVAVIAGCILSTSARAESFFQVEAGLGGTAYDKGGDGLWYQDAFQHKLELTAPAVKFGVTGDLFTRPRWGIAWHADYVWLGTVHTQAMATPSDANYDTHTKSCVGACWPLANYVGSGHDAGFALTVEPYYNIGPWRLGLEVGPYIHRYSWAVDVTGWRPSADAAPSNIHVDNKPRWILGATAGITASYKNLSIEYQYFYNPAPRGENVPPIWHGAYVLMARYRF